VVRAAGRAMIRGSENGSRDTVFGVA
jgi:hypothetical protein